MFVVPRSNLSYLNTQEKLQKPAFYILLGEDESTKPQAYIGETENFKERVKDHDSKKSFWQKALIFVSKDADMTKVDVQYLEHKAIAEAKKANAFVLSDNKQIPKAPNLYNPQIQISAESETKRSIFREKDKTKRSKKESAQHSKSRNKSFVMTSVSAL